MSVDQDRLQQTVRDNIERLCREFFPLGARDGNEWKIADVSGAKGNSLGICLTGEKAGLWRDRATGQGGQFANLLMESRAGLGFPEAAGLIEKCLGINLRTGENGEFNWKSLERLNSNHQTRLVGWRGFTPEAVKRFADSDLLRILTKNGLRHWAFPVVIDGKVKGCHHRPINVSENEEVKWAFWPTKGHGGPGTQPFIIGNQKAPTNCPYFRIVLGRPISVR